MTVVIQCHRLSKSYGKMQALRNLSFTIEDKKITGLIGRNGAGKTTLQKIIAGFYRKTSGEITVFGKEPFNSLFVSANSIFVSDEMSFPISLTLQEILEEAGQFYANWDGSLAKKLLDYFSLNPKNHYYNLSKGMKSTFNMIVGLTSRCELTIFDEPTLGMDASVRAAVYRALLKDYLVHPRSIIISSHYLNEIEHLLEDVLVLKDGEALLHLPMSELKEWAIGVQGETSLVKEWIKTRELIHTEQLGTGRLYAVVKNQEVTDSDAYCARLEGLKVFKVSPSDLCIYLTNKHQGGIDDVFRNDEFN